MLDKIEWEDCPIGAGIAEKVNALHEAVLGENGLKDMLCKQNGRVRKNEIKIAVLYGGILLLAFIIPIVAPIIWAKIIGN